MSITIGIGPRGAVGNRHLVTGATGFVGAALVLELLARDPAAEVYCLVRGASMAESAARLQAALSTAAHLYGAPAGVADSLPQRTRALRGDIRLGHCGLRRRHVGRVTQVWHAAARVDCLDQRSADIDEQNILGTASVVQTSRMLDVDVLNHVSTADVAGSRTGVVREDDPPDPTASTTAYHRSKAAAEQLVAASGVPARILRPSIVIGHSTTHATTSSAAVHRAISALRAQATERHSGPVRQRQPMPVRALPDAELNLIPVDVLARAAVGLSQHAAPPAVYHLTNTAAPTVAAVSAGICAELAISPFEFVPSEQDVTGSDLRVDTDPRAAFYRLYAHASRTFDSAHTSAVLGPAALHSPLPENRWRQHVKWHLDTLELGEPDHTSELALSQASG